ALYRLLKTRHGEKPWPEWDSEYARRDAEALQGLQTEAAAQIFETKIIQFLFFEQWQQLRRYANERSVRLFGDLPIYIALDSADAWAHPELLQIDRDGRPVAVAGVPPDYFSEDGQLWGNPLYDWEHHARTGYRWWIARVRAAVELCDLVRIDHFRGFESYWAIPADADTARHGAWEPGPGDAIFDALRESLGGLPIVAEDLGLITQAVEALRDRHNIPGMTVLQFAIADPGFNLSDVAENRICYTGTHDNDTTVGWFHGSDKDLRTEEEIRTTQQRALAMTNGSPETIHTDLIRAAFSTAALLAIVPMQDLLGLGSDARFNTPGTAGGNWRWRVLDSQFTPDICDNVAKQVEDANREYNNR
ncbi:MAG: 4-alpha-glucanotransferase, partial [Pseudomonadota bacterium]